MTASPARYEIRVGDVPGEDWSAWFDRLQAASDGIVQDLREYAHAGPQMGVLREWKP